MSSKTNETNQVQEIAKAYKVDKYKNWEQRELTIMDQLILECTAMSKFAFASGLDIPPKLIQMLEAYIHGKAPNLGKSDDDNVTNCEVTDIRPLIQVHERLANIVEPAKPRTILLMDMETKRAGRLKFLGVVPFIRRMMMATIVCLVMFILISLSPSINNEPNSWNLFESSGWALLLKEMFLLSAAGLGASFTTLFRANRFIVEGTFDPKYESSYWIRFSLGFIAGMILATLIPIEESVSADFGKPLLAMLGGFSADLVYRIIARVIETLEALFRGDQRTVLKAQKEQVQARSVKEKIKTRVDMVSKVVKLQQELDANTPPDVVKKKVGKLLDNVMGVDTDDYIIDVGRTGGTEVRESADAL